METVGEFLEEWRNGEPFVQAHTSGSTGKPKDIRLLKADMCASARATNAFFSIGKESVVGMALSTDYIAGKMMCVRAELAGADIVAIKPTNNILLDGVGRPIDLFAIVPSQIQSFIEHPEYAFKVRNLLIGGAAPTAEQCHMLTLAGYSAWISYGMTETCSHVALARADDPLRVFSAMPGISFETSSDGRLCINCSNFSVRRLETNDIVELLSPTKFRWRGRADGVINSGGVKMIPEELEALYAPAMHGLPFYVVGVPDAKWGQAVALVAETDVDTLSKIEIELRAAIQDHRKLPKKYLAVSELPRTSNGKIRRCIIPET